MHNIGTPLQAFKFALTLDDEHGGATAIDFLRDWDVGDISDWPSFNEIINKTLAEPEHTADDGTVRKDHYGAGRQPWDDIKDAGWGPAFAAGNVLKYLRRTKAEEDSLLKAKWYYARLHEFHPTNSGLAAWCALHELLTREEIERLK